MAETVGLLHQPGRVLLWSWQQWPTANTCGHSVIESVRELFLIILHILTEEGLETTARAVGSDQSTLNYVNCYKWKLACCVQVFMYVCMCLCVHVHSHVCVCVHMCVHIHVCVCACVYEHTHVHKCVHAQVRVAQVSSSCAIYQYVLSPNNHILPKWLSVVDFNFIR